MMSELFSSSSTSGLNATDITAGLDNTGPASVSELNQSEVLISRPVASAAGSSELGLSKASSASWSRRSKNSLSASSCCIVSTMSLFTSSKACPDSAVILSSIIRWTPKSEITGSDISPSSVNADTASSNSGTIAPGVMKPKLPPEFADPISSENSLARSPNNSPANTLSLI